MIRKGRVQKERVHLFRILVGVIIAIIVGFVFFSPRIGNNHITANTGGTMVYAIPFPAILFTLAAAWGILLCINHIQKKCLLQ